MAAHALEGQRDRVLGPHSTPAKGLFCILCTRSTPTSTPNPTKETKSSGPSHSSWVPSLAWCALRYAALHPGSQADDLVVASCHLLTLALHRAWGAPPSAQAVQVQCWLV